jgi:2-methylcitrate dehydratase PrpD
LQSKFSLTHSAAVALIDRAAGVPQYTDARALAPDVSAMRNKIKVITNDGYRTDQAAASLVLGGHRLEAIVDHATGTVSNPISDEGLEAKFLSNASTVLGTKRALELSDKIADIKSITDMREITLLCSPSQ